MRITGQILRNITNHHHTLIQMKELNLRTNSDFVILMNSIILRIHNVIIIIILNIIMIMMITLKCILTFINVIKCFIMCERFLIKNENNVRSFKLII